MSLLKLAWQSLLDRKGSVLLALCAMTISIFVMLGVEQIRHQAKANFASTVSGVDLIVGARTGQLNLLLYSVFRIGAATNNISWDSYQAIARSPSVAWAIPISLGDSHKGYRVMGTTPDYFKHFQYGAQHPLRLTSGKPFSDTLDVVLGAEVARRLDYQVGDRLVLSHGIGSVSFTQHTEHPFTVVGILEPTGTPVDQTLHVSLEGIEAIHVGFQQATDSETGAPSITAAMVGLKSKMATFIEQRRINNYSSEPLMAILPGVALAELWQMMAFLEKTLVLVSALVFVSACLGVAAMLLSSIRERRHEIELLRVIGAPPLALFLLVELEALLMAGLSSLFAVVLLAASLYLMQGSMTAQFGITVDLQILTPYNAFLLGAIFLAVVVAAAIPAARMYRISLQP